LLISEFGSTDGVQVDVDPLVGWAAVIALEEEAGTVAIGVDNGREVVSLLPRDTDGIGKGIPGVESFRRRLDYIAQRSRPEVGEPIGVLAGEDDLN
jgi:hypothetical protein